MPYTLKFSDKLKPGVVVPDMPPGINTVDTSLNLIGKGYPAYGEKTAENFLHLLENFASPIPPENPIEGQLWYDTSDPKRKVLRVMDRAGSYTRWPSVSGIYRQTTDPKTAANSGLKNGDIWVDLSNNSLKIFNNNDWSTIGSTNSSVTGFEVVTVSDNAGSDHTVITAQVNNNKLFVLSNESFIPNSLAGFTSIKPGINLSSSVGGVAAQVLGTADNANKLGGFDSANYLRKNDDSSSGQLITGKVIFVTPSLAGAEGRDGVVIRLSSDPVNEYVQFYKNSDGDAVLFNNKDGGKVSIRVKGVATPRVIVDKNVVTFNTSTVVSGSVTASNEIRANSVRVLDSVQVDKNVIISQNLKVSGVTTASNGITIGESGGSGTGISSITTATYDIGTAAKPFRNLYVESVYADNVYAYNFDPPGTLKLHPGNMAPDGWLFCTGTSLVRNNFQDLFAAIGTYYGSLSTTTFNIPNLSVSSTQNSYTTTTYYIIKT